MRRFVFCLVLVLVLLYPIQKVTAGETDSVTVSLLTCAPGDEIYSIFGHTAIRYHDITHNRDFVFNYGLFNFSAPGFVWRFVLGKTDYMLGVAHFEDFIAEYQANGRGVWEQRLNLSDYEKNKIFQLLSINHLPQNRVYRYNFFFDNCATRPRDKIEECLYGTIVYPDEPADYSLTLRDVLDEFCQVNPWYRYGIDFIVGSKSDRPATQREMMFAPLYLMRCMDKAKIELNSVQYNLVRDKETLVENTGGKSRVILTPFQTSLLVFILTVGATIYCVRKRKALWGIDIILFGFTGLGGCLLAFMALFSEHPAVDANYLMFLFHPCQLFFLPYIVYCGRKLKRCWYMTLNLIVLTFFIVLFAFFPQRMDPANIPLALSLWVRSASNLIITAKKSK